MGQRTRSSSFLPWMLLVVPVAAAVSCGKSAAPSGESGLPTGVFGGGSGGISGVQQPSLAGASGASAGAATTMPALICQNVPQGTRALLDDFEDGDSIAVPEPDREAYWF